MRICFACTLPLFLDLSSKFRGVAILTRRRRDTQLPLYNNYSGNEPHREQRNYGRNINKNVLPLKIAFLYLFALLKPHCKPNINTHLR